MKVNFKKISISDVHIKWLILSFGILWVIYHIITVERSPIPNFDEAFFASMTRAVQDEGTLMLRMSTRPINEANEMWLYGPVYFYMQALIIEIIGWGIWQFRLLNLVSGILLIAIIIAIAKKLLIARYHLIVAFLLLITDPAINANMHSGRMDSLAMLLFTVGIYFFFFPPDSSKIYTVLAGCFYSLAFLTTPRTGFLLLLLPIGFVLETFWSLRDHGNSGKLLLRIMKVMHVLILRYAIPFIIIITPFFLWVQFRIGGIKTYIGFFSEYQDLAPLYKIFNLPAFYQLPTIGIWMLAILVVGGLLMLRKQLNCKVNLDHIDRRLVFIVILPVLYVLFIKGGYSVFLMPWVYLSLIYISGYLSINLVPFWGRSILNYACIGILILNTAIFGIKSITIATSWKARDPAHFANYFEKINLKEQNILASFPYHFVISNNNRFISNDSHRELSLEKANNLNIQHAFITSQYYAQDKQYFDKLGFELVDSFSFKENLRGSILIGFLDKMPLDILWDTDGVHLQRSLSKFMTQELDGDVGN